MNPLQERRARVTVKVVRPSSNANEGEREITYAFEQHRMSIQVGQGGNQFGNAKVAIYGVPLDAMNKIARLWLEVLSPTNTDTLTIDVWDGSNFVPFFAGVITWSAINAGGAPQVALEIEANSAMIAMNTVAAPYAQDEPVGLQAALQQILEPTGLVVEFADSVPVLEIQRAHLIGTPMDQAAALMNYFPELTWYINLQRFLVRPVNGPLGSDPVPINKTNGMIGYPTYSTSGVQLATIFNPRIRPGLALDIQTMFDFVNRTKWVAAVLQHNIEPNMPGGQWMTAIAAQSYGSKGDGSGSET
jgi:hypothetical protein